MRLLSSRIDGKRPEKVVCRSAVTAQGHQATTACVHGCESVGGGGFKHPEQVVGEAAAAQGQQGGGVHAHGERQVVHDGEHGPQCRGQPPPPAVPIDTYRPCNCPWTVAMTGVIPSTTIQIYDCP